MRWSSRPHVDPTTSGRGFCRPPVRARLLWQSGALSRREVEKAKLKSLRVSCVSAHVSGEKNLITSYQRLSPNKA